MQKLFLLFGFLLTNSIFAMQTQEKPPRPQVPAELSKEIVQFIMNSATLEDAVEAVKKYALIDPKIETSPEISNFLISKFGEKYFGNNLLFAALFLNTEGAKNWLSNEGKQWISQNKSYIETIFTNAVRNGNLRLVKILLKEGIDPNAPDQEKAFHGAKEAPIMLAARFGNLEMIKILLDAGANADAHFDLENTALYWAINNIADQNKRIEIIKLLLDAGANPYLKIKDINPLELADANPFLKMQNMSPIELAKYLANSLPEFSQVVELLEEYKPVQKGKK